jgi:hypothetical protein
MFRKYQALFKMPVDKFANLDQAVKEHEGMVLHSSTSRLCASTPLNPVSAFENQSLKSLI